MTVRIQRTSPTSLVVHLNDGNVRTYQGPKAELDKDEARERAKLVGNSSKLVRNRPPADPDEDELLPLPVMNFADRVQHTEPILGLPDTDPPKPSYFGAAGAPVGNDDDDEPLVPPVMNFEAASPWPTGGVPRGKVRNRGAGGQSPVNSSHGDDSEVLPLPPTTF